VLERTIPSFYTDGGERCHEPDSPKSLRDFIDDSEGQVVGDGLRRCGDKAFGVESFSARDPLNFGRAYGLHPANTLGTLPPHFSEDPRDFSDDPPIDPP